MLGRQQMAATTTETRATAVVLIGVTSAIISSGYSELTFLEPLTIWLGLFATFSLTLLIDSSDGKYFRRNAASGILCCCLLPVAKLLSEASARDNNSDGDLLQIFLEGSFIVSLTVMCRESIAKFLEKKQYGNCDNLVLVASVIAVTVAWFVLTLKAWNLLGTTELFVCLGVLFIQFLLHRYLPAWLPRSFTLGEAAIASQGCAMFCILAGMRYLHAWQRLKRGDDVTSSSQVILFIQTAVSSCAAVLVVLVLVPCFRSVIGYYFLVPGIAATFSLPILLTFFNQDFVTWCFEYITGNRIKMYLFCYWFISCLTAVVIVYFNASSVVQISNSKKPQVKISHHAASTVRKHFHLLALAIYLPGLLLDVEILYTAVSCAFVVLVMLESMRVLLIPPIGEMLHQYFQVFVDERDEGPVILTHIYLLIGCSIPLWIDCSHVTRVALYSGLVSLGIGDTLASVAGLKFGSHKWMGTRKTVEGTFCAIFGQFAFILLLHITGALVVPWIKCSVAIVLTSLLEAFTTQLDNLLLPIFMYILLV